MKRISSIDRAIQDVPSFSAFSVRKYFRLFGLAFPFGSNPPIPNPQTLPTVLGIEEKMNLFFRLDPNLL